MVLTRKGQGGMHVITSSKKIKFLNPLQKQMTGMSFAFTERGDSNKDAFEKLLTSLDIKRIGDLGPKTPALGPFADEWRAFLARTPPKGNGGKKRKKRKKKEKKEKERENLAIH